MKDAVADAAALFSPCLCESLRRTTRAMTRLYDDALRPTGLRITQFSVLARLVAEGEARVRDLSTSLAVEETTLTRSLATLEKQGWVTSRSGTDQRERLVSISAAGKKVLARAVPFWADAQERVLERITSGAWRGLMQTLPKVVAAADAG